MAKVVSGLANYNETVSKFAVHRYLLDACMKSFADEGIIKVSEIEQMILTGFDTDKKEYKESKVIELIINRLQSQQLSDKEKLRLSMLAFAAMELSASDRKAITDQLAGGMAQHLLKLSAFGLSLEAAGKTKKRLSRLYISSLQSRMGPITKIFNYSIPKLSDLIFAANTNTLDAEGFAFGKYVPMSSEDTQPKVQSLRKKQNAVNKSRKKIIIFIIGGILHSEIRVIKEFPDIHLVMGGSKVQSPLEFVEEIMEMSRDAVIPDVDPRDVEIDFR